MAWDTARDGLSPDHARSLGLPAGLHVRDLAILMPERASPGQRAAAQAARQAAAQAAVDNYNRKRRTEALAREYGVKPSAQTKAKAGTYAERKRRTDELAREYGLS